MIETELLHHGYLFVFLGTIFEEDSRLLTSTFLAHRGYLHFSWVLIIAAMSTVAANQAYFLIARRTGVKWLDTASAGSRKIETVITKVGTEIAVHYTTKGTVDTAEEVDRIGKDGMRLTEGTLKQIERVAKTVPVTPAHDAAETLR